MSRFLLFACLLSLVACSREAANERFYSYMDSQGNLIQLQSSAATAEKVEAVTEDELGKTDEEMFQSDEQVQARLKALENDRFIAYQDASGYRVVQPVRIADEKEARDALRDQQYQALEAPAFIDRIEPFDSDCCVHATRAGKQIKRGAEQLLSFRERRLGWIRHAEHHPAYAYQLEPELRHLRVQSFIRQQTYLHPHVLLLDGQGIPVLYIDNLFDRRYPENWYRHGYLEGEFAIPEEARFVVFYLPYQQVMAVTKDGIGVTAVEPIAAVWPWQVSGLELASSGELLIKGLSE